VEAHQQLDGQAAQTQGVNRFQKSGPGLAMDLDRQSDYALRQISMFGHGNTSPWPLAALVVLRVRNEGRMKGLADAAEATTSQMLALPRHSRCTHPGSWPQIAGGDLSIDRRQRGGGRGLSTDPGACKGSGKADIASLAGEHHVAV
jgi:hypothetical protein